MQVDFLMFLQKISNPVLDKIFVTLTNLGDESFYILAISIIVWCVNKRLGIRLFTILIFSTYGNSTLKDIFRTQRPIYHEGIKSLYTKSAPGYSFPSGHTQGTTTFWFYLMHKLRNKTAYIIGWSVVVVVAFSRLYLRVHWPIDVIGGLIFGILFALFGEYLINKISSLRFNYLNTFMFAVVLPNILLLVYTTENNIKMIGLITGALLGYFVEMKNIDFKVQNILSKQIIKYVLGVLIIISLKIGLKVVFPTMLIFDYIRYFAIGIFSTLIIPYLFVKTGLAERQI